MAPRQWHDGGAARLRALEQVWGLDHGFGHSSRAYALHPDPRLVLHVGRLFAALFDERPFKDVLP
jgi:hypothetical protein